MRVALIMKQTIQDSNGINQKTSTNMANTARTSLRFAITPQFFSFAAVHSHNSETMAIIKYLKFILAVTLVQCPCASAQSRSFVEGLINFFSYGQSLLDNEPADTTWLRPSYDFVIVGAGSAGCVLANRLTENPDWNVLLLEAGRNENFLMDVPILTTLLQFTQANWNYRTEPQASGCLGMKGGRCHWPRGKIMGGSSVLHHMIHTRGNRRDYDRWAEAGNPGWSFEQVLPYFKKSENINIPHLANDTEYHGTEGYLPVTYPPWKTPLADAFLKAGQQLGFPLVDYNGRTQTGFSILQTTLKNGTRMSLSRAYLHPISERKNLHVRKNAMVTKILIDPESLIATGVEFLHNGQSFVINADKEVILSAGAINSPQLLMLSGIGPKNHLKKMGIPVLQNLKVGYNLQDHIALGGLTFLVNDTVSIVGQRLLQDPENIYEFLVNHDGPFSDPAGSEALAFIDTKNMTATDGYPDLELLFLGGSYASMEPYKDAFAISDKVYNEVYESIQGRDSWMVFPMLMLPKSTGRVLLRSKNPLKKPLLHANYLSHPDDIDVIIKGIRLAIKLSKTQAFQKYNSTLHDVPLPACQAHVFNTDDYWRCAVKQITQTIYHLSGTCKMGPKSSKSSVVDARLRIHGVKRLRVVDASIMPHLPTAHTNAPTVMIAEKASDDIKQDWNFK